MPLSLQRRRAVAGRALGFLRSRRGVTGAEKALLVVFALLLVILAVLLPR